MPSARQVLTACLPSSLPAGEIDRCLKKVSEGVEQFEDIWQKVQGLGLQRAEPGAGQGVWGGMRGPEGAAPGWVGGMDGGGPQRAWHIGTRGH